MPSPRWLRWTALESQPRMKLTVMPAGASTPPWSADALHAAVRALAQTTVSRLGRGPTASWGP